ncbi:UNVERIFIED_CONTAM: hypothetical protein H355_014592 [Colinus virginianus]|nr:hypothetical protein H355_014592 [Colinus virginianus]
MYQNTSDKQSRIDNEPLLNRNSACVASIVASAAFAAEERRKSADCLALDSSFSNQPAAVHFQQCTVYPYRDSVPGIAREVVVNPDFSCGIMECNAIEQDCGEEPLLEVTKEKSSTDAATKLGQIKDASLSSEQKEPNQKNQLAIDHQMCKAVEKFEHLEEQTDKTDPESRGNFVGVENPVLEEVGSTASQSASSPAEMREGRLEEADLSCVKGNIQVSTSCSCVPMEVDAAEHSVAEVHISASKKWQAENGKASDLNSGACSVEVESL